MKYLLWLFVLSAMTAHAKTFYFSDSQGNDANTSTQAQSSSTPWKSLSQLSNAAIATGDSVLFKSGDVFFGSIELLKGLKFNSYGTGKMPEITGFYQVTSWTENPAGSGIYESEQLPTGTTLNMVNINGKAYAMG